MDEAQVEEIIAFLDYQKLKYKMDWIHEFYACLEIGGNIKKEYAFQRCSGKYCHVLKNGKISACPAPMVGQYINSLGADIDFTDGTLDIYKNIDTDLVVSFLNSPHNACCYCAAPKPFAWELQTNGATLEDWRI